MEELFFWQAEQSPSFPEPPVDCDPAQYWRQMALCERDHADWYAEHGNYAEAVRLFRAAGECVERARACADR